MWTIIISLILVSYLVNIPYQKDHNGNKQDLSQTQLFTTTHDLLSSFNSKSQIDVAIPRLFESFRYGTPCRFTREVRAPRH